MFHLHDIVSLCFSDFQVSFDTLQASWDTSGDPCPAVKYEWAITRLDGMLTQSLLDMRSKCCI